MAELSDYLTFDNIVNVITIILGICIILLIISVLFNMKGYMSGNDITVSVYPDCDRLAQKQKQN